MGKSKWDDLNQDDILSILKDIYKEFGYLKHDHYKKLVGERGLPSITSIFRILNTKRWIEVVNLLEIDELKKTSFSYENSNVLYLREYGLEKLKEYYNYLGRIPSTQDFKNNKWKPSSGWYYKHFGSIKNACLEVGVISLEQYSEKKPRIVSDNTYLKYNISKSERIKITISEIQRISNLLGRYPIQKEYNENIIDGSYYYSSIFKVFKMPFHDFCKLYAPGYEFIRKDFPKSMPILERKEILIKELKDVSLKIGKTPTQNELSKYGLREINVYIKYFNKPYNEILKDIGLELNKRYLEQTDEELLNDFYNVFVKLGHVPIGQEYINNNLEGKWNYTNRFGSIKNVCDLLDIDFEKYYKPNVAGIICLDNNGDICRSIIEKDITNFYILNNLHYLKEYSYSNLIKGDKRRFDWKLEVNDEEYYVEYAGMYHEDAKHSIQRKYTKKIKNKIETLVKHNLIDKCIFIYPDDIKNKSLKEIFDNILNLDLINLEYSQYNDVTKYNDLSDEEIYDLFMKYYKESNDLRSKSLVSYNYSLYAEIISRYDKYFYFLEKYNFNNISKPKGYWNYDNIMLTFLHMVNNYDDILTQSVCREISKTDLKLKGFIESTMGKFGGYKKMQLEFYNFCQINNIILSDKIINKIFSRNKEAI